ncbi:tRNA pseudouridine32 synthase / 23S rRNA pseudouridine746 synthase [Spirosomataceae bacterium TFI 002]|nr:tRNA pseudouridine32 synthase / 23S rRNA pseudouridine746 synthase [Spirosomataceae bacterium TFI 002]
MPESYLNKQFIFDFKTNITEVSIPQKLNNPFAQEISEIAKIAAAEFQEFISKESKHWGKDFLSKKGKMFGVLVVQKEDLSYCFIGTVSGKLPLNAQCDQFIPSVFLPSMGDFFINKGMTELTEIGKQIKESMNPVEIDSLKLERSQKSFALQRRLFENYHFMNLSGRYQNLLEIFAGSSHGNPPTAAGECVAPKVLQFAFQHHLKPIALAEFWWGKPIKNDDKKHKAFYPACKDRCRPILEYMLEDTELFDKRSY